MLDFKMAFVCFAFGLAGGFFIGKNYQKKIGNKFIPVTSNMTEPSPQKEPEQPIKQEEPEIKEPEQNINKPEENKPII